MILPVVLSSVTGIFSVISTPSLSFTTIVVFSVSITYVPFSSFFTTFNSILPSNLLYPSGAVVSFITYLSGVSIFVISIVPKFIIPFSPVTSLSSPFTLNIAPSSFVPSSPSCFTRSIV